MPGADHNCPIAGAVGANHSAVLRELDQLRLGLERSLRDQGDLLMDRIEDRFSLKLAACDGLEERVDQHEARLEAIDKDRAERRGEGRAHRAWGHLILGGIYAILGAAAAMFGGHFPIKH